MIQKKIPLLSLEEKILHDLNEVRIDLLYRRSELEGLITEFINSVSKNIRTAFKEFVEENELQEIVATGREKISIHGEVGQGKYPFALDSLENLKQNGE